MRYPARRRAAVTVGAVVSTAAAALAGSSAAAAEPTDGATVARAFIAALNSADRSKAVTYLAQNVQFAIADAPPVRYRGRARYDFVSSAFGTNCAFRPGRAVVVTRAASRVVRVPVVLRADRGHRCIAGQQGEGALFTMTVTRTLKIAALRITDT
jgi:hypothetical protein